MNHKKLILALLLLIILTGLSPPQKVIAQEATQHHIIINKATNQLAYYNNLELIRLFPVGTGKTSTLTPEGTFNIAAKFVKPYYSSGNIAGGSPKNPLGVRWLGLSVGNTGGSVYGIHGNNNPNSIGGYVSAGCIRMYNDDVIWLYSQVPMGTKVTIIDEAWDLGPTMSTWWGNKTKEPVQQQSDITVIANNTDVSFTSATKPYLSENNPMLPLRPIADALNITVTYLPEIKFIIMQQEDNIVGIDTTTNFLYSSHGSFQLTNSFIVSKGVSFVGLDLFKLLQIDVQWNPDENFMIIN